MRCIISHIYLIKYSTCFGQVHCPSSGVSQHCIHSNRYLSCRFCWRLLRAYSQFCWFLLRAYSQQNQHDIYLLRLQSVEILLMMDSERVRSMWSTLSNKSEKWCSSLAFIIKIYHCNAQRFITGKRWIDILLVFINLDFEMRFDNFTRATCILYIYLVEALNFQLRCLVEKVAHDKIQ